MSSKHALFKVNLALLVGISRQLPTNIECDFLLASLALEHENSTNCSSASGTINNCTMLSQIDVFEL